MSETSSSPEQTTEILRCHQRALADLAALASEFSAPPQLFRQIVAQVGRAVEIDHVKIMRYRPEQGDLLCEAGVGWKDGVVGLTTFALDLSSPPGRALQTGQAVSIPDIEKQSEFRYSKTLEDHGIRALLNTPIMVEGAAWGVLEIDSTTPRDFSEDTINFLRAAAWITGAAIRRHASECERVERAAQAARDAEIRELLLREMQHRVKNYFQIILAMIALRQRKLRTPHGRTVLAEVAEAVMSVALAHDQLSPGRTGEAVSLPTYLRALVNRIERPLDGVVIEVTADDLSVEVEQAATIGLIVNELVTNSVKHAFGPDGGSVHVQLRTGGSEGEAELWVIDNGVGIDPENKGGTGMSLVEGLARQLRGAIHAEPRDPGTAWRLMFPI